MKKIIIIFFTLLALSWNNAAKSQDFFDTSDAENFFTFSGRIGFNTSNKTFPSGHFNLWNNNGWGTGFNIGVLANLNFKEYFSLQPGIFAELRRGTFSYLTTYLNYYGAEDEHYEMGNLKGGYVTIPVMGIFKFNLAENIKWSVEAGPYFQWAVKQAGINSVTVLYRLPQNNQYSQYKAKYNSIDAGVKMGMGLTFYRHYYVGVHYLAGLCHAWKQPVGGKNKSWLFTAGYDF